MTIYQVSMFSVRQQRIVHQPVFTNIHEAEACHAFYSKKKGITVTTEEIMFA